VALPLADPQFWLVTGGALAALVYFARKLRRRARDEAATPCDRCPKPGNPLGPRRLGAVTLAALGFAAAAGAETVERRVAAMGTTLRVEVEVTTDRAAALALAEALIGEVAAAERRLSTWRDDSELAKINRTPVGEWVVTSAYGELVAAWQCRESTGGAFHPGVGRLVAAWDLRGAGRVPTAAEIEAARRGLDRLAYEDSNHPNRIRRTADVLLEEGAFGKGAGLDAALDALARPSLKGTGFVRLDLGGQVAWANATRPIVVDLADPRDRSRPVLELTLTGERGSLAVSGNSERPHLVGGESFGHLLDPRSGRPAADFGAVAIAVPRALEADCLSTALFVMGPDEGSRWLAGQRPHDDAVFLVVDGERLRARLTAGLAGRARPLVAELQIEVLGS
jgi:thiamine biosynthesis lipoprotein